MSGHDIIIVRTKSIGGGVMSPRMGRPQSDNPKSSRIEIRVTDAEKKDIMEYSKENKISLLELLRLGIEKDKEK